MEFETLINDLPKKGETVITMINENDDVNVVKLRQAKEELMAVYKSGFLDRMSRVDTGEYDEIGRGNQFYIEPMNKKFTIEVNGIAHRSNVFDRLCKYSNECTIFEKKGSYFSEHSFKITKDSLEEMLNVIVKGGHVKIKTN